MQLTPVLSLLLAASPVLSIVLPSKLNIHEKLEAIPRGWHWHRDAEPHEPCELHVALPEQNMDSFHARLMDISTPGHKLYGEHFEGHEVDEWIKPAEETAEKVADWLKSHGVAMVRGSKDFISFRTTVHKANEMLGTKFAWFHNSEKADTKLRALEYSVPEELGAHVDFIYPTVKFPTTEYLRSTINRVGGADEVEKIQKWLASDPLNVEGVLSTAQNLASAVCNTAITPQCLLSLYNVHYGAQPNSKLAFASFLNQSARNSDLATFENTIATYAKGKTYNIVPFAPATNDQTSSNDATEANLDGQYQIGVGYPSPVTEFITAGCGPLIPDPNEPAGACDNEPYVQFLTNILKLPNSQLPQTLSASYGEDEQTWPQPIATKVCNMLSQLGARGVTVFFSSGDSGPGAICTNNDGTQKKYVPNFPASCPFVTTVGGTVGTAPEKAVDFSGGGFSNYFARPSYQNAAVQGFLKQAAPQYKQYYNQTGRAYPDVAAQGVGFLVVSGGIPEPVDGTSASAPTFAAIVNLLNSARISKGLKPLGFANPFFYQSAAAFNDITSGASSGCTKGTSAQQISGGGFRALKGWDPATGLGTPNFGKLLNLAAPGVANTGGPVPA